MDASVPSITPAALRQAIESDDPPLVIDVRRQERFLESRHLVRGALRRKPQALDVSRNVVVYCVHGHAVSQDAAKALGARYLEGGIEGWRAAGGPLDGKPQGGATRWVTRERPKIDR